MNYTFTFAGKDTDFFEKAKTGLTANGGIISGDTTCGALTYEHVSGTYRIEANQIQIEITKHPKIPFINALIRNTLDKFFNNL